MAHGLESLQNINWLGTKKALIEIDRELVRRGGLRAFCELAWGVLEPATVFKPGWHIDELCRELEDVMHGRNRRLAIAMPPRHMKSMIVAVFFPVYAWIHNPSEQFMFLSYDFSLSTRDNTKARDLVKSDWFQARWGDKVRIKTDNVTLVETVQRGYRLALSLGGRVMGKGANFIVVDDPFDTKDVESDVKRTEIINFWKERLQSRLNDPSTGAFVVVHQRVAVNDLIGYILKQQPGEYRYMSLPARFDPEATNIWPRDPRRIKGELLWPGHIGDDVLDRFRQNMGVYAYEAQYQQSPSSREGGLFKKHWFPIHTGAVPGDMVWKRGWDWAATVASQTKPDPDYTATVLIGFSRTTQKYYVGHAGRWRVDSPEVDRLLKFYADEDEKRLGKGVQSRLPQDPAAAGKARAQQHGILLTGHSFVIKPVTGDKAVRAAPLAGQAGIGNVMLIEGAWNDEFIAEFTSFPTGAHDDQVDAASEAFNAFMITNTGLLDYYADKAKQGARVPGRTAGRDGFQVYEDDTSNLADGFTPGR
jgi:predicted phage terminase large subunit-like protein